MSSFNAAHFRTHTDRTYDLSRVKGTHRHSQKGGEGMSRAAKGADCKSTGDAFVGSRPTSPTISQRCSPANWVLRAWEASEGIEPPYKDLQSSA